MLPTTSAVQGQFPSQTLEGGGVPAASAHRIDGRLCGSVLDLLMQGHRLKVPDSELFAGAFEMLATGRDDGLHEAMKRASETAGGGRRAGPPRSIAEILKPIQDRGLAFEVRVCDDLDFLLTSEFTPWSRGLDSLKSVIRIPTPPREPRDAGPRRGLDLLLLRSHDVVRRCDALEANGCALVFGPNGCAVVFKDHACRLSTMALRGVGDPIRNVPVLTQNDAAMSAPQPATEVLHRVMLMPASAKWAMAVAVARPVDGESPA